MMETALLIVFVLLLLPGVVGIFIPVLPGIPLMFFMALFFAVLTGFNRLTGTEIGYLGFIALSSLVVDYLSGVIGARYGGASRKSLGYGLLGILAGTLLMPPFGGIIGLFIAITISEISQFGDRDKALKAAQGGVIGAVVGIGINLILALLFIGLFIAYALK